MNKKLCNFRFDQNFVSILNELSGLEGISKTAIIRKSVLKYTDENMVEMRRLNKLMEPNNEINV